VGEEPTIPELAQHIVDVTRARDLVRRREAELDEARRDFSDRLRAAHSAGLSYAVLGRSLGLTRQRVARIVER
jgi:hypothetical protein